MVKVAPEMPHRLARDAQPSPDTTVIVRQLAAAVKAASHEKKKARTTALTLRVLAMVETQGHLDTR